MALETRLPGARCALALLLVINLFNYIDRYILAAVLPEIRKAFFAPGDPNAMRNSGMLATAFLLSYIVMAPLFGWLADRSSRWMLAGSAVALWSLASGASGLATTFTMLLVTRVFVGVGEAGFGPAAPPLIADYFQGSARGRVLSFFYLASPVGSALGFAFGGGVGAVWGWRWPFYLVIIPGLALAILCYSMPDPRNLLARHMVTQRLPYVSGKEAKEPVDLPFREGLLGLLRNRSYLYNTAAMTAMSFTLGGLGFWMPSYIIEYRGQPNPGFVNIMFGGIMVVSGLLATISGGYLADGMKRRYPSSYFLVSGAGVLTAFPLTVAMLFTPFPWFWAVLFAAIFFLFFNIGPANAALADVTAPSIRATAFAVNIFMIHALGDAISPPLMGAIADRWEMNVAFLTVSGAIAIAGFLWIRGIKYLESDTKAVSEFMEAQSG